MGAPVHGEAGRAHIAMLAVDARGAAVACRYQAWLGSVLREQLLAGTLPD